MWKKINRKLVGICTVCSVLAPTALIINSCSPLRNVITFNNHAPDLTYGKSMTLSANCTFGTVAKLSAEGTGKNTN
jgi:hypothetical protein